jgi:hypothetical protein
MAIRTTNAWDLSARPGAPDRAYTADIEAYDGDAP